MEVSRTPARIKPPRILAGRRVGLLGGSFNPAHDGHLHISRLALKALDLDEIWWLVSPQNPLKSSDEMASFEDRFARAAEVAAPERRIRVSDFETRLGTRYTADTIEQLLKRHKRQRYVWIMGADNLIQIPRWQRWTYLSQCARCGFRPALLFLSLIHI